MRYLFLLPLAVRISRIILEYIFHFKRTYFCRETMSSCLCSTLTNEIFTFPISLTFSKLLLQEYNSYQERVHTECFWEHNQSSTVATIYTRMHERSHGNLKNNYLYLILWLISLSSYPFICLFTNSLFFLDKVSCIFLFTHLDIYLQTWLPLYLIMCLPT